jgi:hypothetical protein
MGLIFFNLLDPKNLQMFTYSASIHLKTATATVGVASLEIQYVGFLQSANEDKHDVQFCFVSVILFALLHTMQCDDREGRSHHL